MRLFNNWKKHNQTPPEGAGTESGEQKHSRQYEELGTIEYVNLTRDGRHGDYETALAVAKATGKPIFANFVEFPG